MTILTSFQQIMDQTAAEHSQRTAVIDPGHGELSYAQLWSMVKDLSATLGEAGLKPGDRMGMYLPKSLASIVSLFSALRLGAAYVPVDAGAPVTRNTYIFKDCGIRALVVERSRVDALAAEWGEGGAEAIHDLPMFEQYGLDLQLLVFPAAVSAMDAPENLAYILYTSGSTGKPKGVMHTESSALGFVNWCLEEFDVSPGDCFSSHAPLHFDLSIFDVFVSLAVGASLCLIDEATGKQPVALAELIAERQISIFYATPSILRLLVEFGKLQDRDYSSLRTVLFAGETYSLKQYLELREIWSVPVFYNLYGPTETNVCTYYRVPDDVGEGDYAYFPIGLVCSGDVLKIVDEDSTLVETGESGELLVSGASVMAGYWNLADRNAEAFVGIDDQQWYRTGDIVRELEDGNIHYLSRRDRMIKRRGYRVELGEIESALYRFQDCVEAAAVAITDARGDIVVKAFLAVRGEDKPSIIALKQFSASNLISYMIPDQFAVLPALPKTSTDKIDYQRLKEM